MSQKIHFWVPNQTICRTRTQSPHYYRVAIDQRIIAVSTSTKTVHQFQKCTKLVLTEHTWCKHFNPSSQTALYVTIKGTNYTHPLDKIVLSWWHNFLEWRVWELTNVLPLFPGLKQDDQCQFQLLCWLQKQVWDMLYLINM